MKKIHAEDLENNLVSIKNLISENSSGIDSRMPNLGKSDKK
jgi:hypothetical protein